MFYIYKRYDVDVNAKKGIKYILNKWEMKETRSKFYFLPFISTMKETSYLGNFYVKIPQSLLLRPKFKAPK